MQESFDGCSALTLAISLSNNAHVASCKVINCERSDLVAFETSVSVSDLLRIHPWRHLIKYFFP